MNKQQTNRKAIVIFVDGGTFNVIDPMLKKAKLPTFQKLMKEGTSGILSSITPPITPAVWASFATGANPGKHGVYDFYDFKKEMTLVNSYSIQIETLWTLLGDVNKHTILLNTPMTYPPRKIRGLTVTGFMTPSNLPFTYPENLQKELLREIPDYKIYTRINPYLNYSLYLDEVYRLLETRSEAALYLMENYSWDLLICYFYCIDPIQHTFWKYIDSGHPAHDSNVPNKLKEAVPKAYKIVDNSINEILKVVDENVTLFVVSDHGFGPIYKYILINNYLRNIGLVKMSTQGIIRQNVDRLFQAIGITGNRMPRLWRYLELASRIALDTIFLKEFEIVESYSSHLSKYINWAQTKAFSAGHFGEIFLHESLRGSDRTRACVIEYLIKKLRELKDPDKDDNIIEKVFKGSEVYNGEHADRAPDLIFFTKEMKYLTRAMHEFATNKIVEPSVGLSAHHRMEGIFLAYGNNVKKSHKIENCNIVDLAPTILYLMGLRIPSHIDGKVFKDIFERSYVKRHPIKIRQRRRPPREKGIYPLSKDEEETIKERLKALGYMG